MVADLLSALPIGTVVGWDTEYCGPNITWKTANKVKTWVDPTRAHLTTISVDWEGHNYVVPVDHPDAKSDPEAVKWMLDFILRSDDLFCVAHNLKADLQVCKNFGCVMPKRSNHLNDSMIAAWLVGWGSGHQKVGLKPIAERLGLPTLGDFESVAKGRQTKDIPIAEIAPYAGLDAFLTRRVFELAQVRMRAYDLEKHFREQDMPLVEIVRGMEEWGTTVDKEMVEYEKLWHTARCEVIAAEFYALTLTEVLIPVKRQEPTGEFYKNEKPKYRVVMDTAPVMLGAKVGNDTQVARWMFEELKLWPSTGLVKTNHGKGHFPTGKDLVETFTILPDKAGYLATLRLEYQSSAKIVSTYIRPFLGFPPQYGDGLLHTSYLIHGTDTQRFSSNGPNLQNIPSRSEAGKFLRKALISRPGWSFVVLDFSQIELRLMAHYSKDPELTWCYLMDIDVHQGTLDGLHAMGWKEAIRTDSKIVNFSSMYRISARRLAIKMKCSVERAEVALEAYFRRFAKFPDYYERAIRYTAKHGYAKAIDGFKCFLDNETVSWHGKQQIPYSSQQNAINLPIQGSSGALTKWSMIQMYEKWTAAGNYGVDRHLAGNEHDSITVECKDEVAAQVRLEGMAIMEQAGKHFNISVPVLAEGGIGKSWADAK